MDVARLDPYGAQDAADAKESLEIFIESELADIEAELQNTMEKWDSVSVPGYGKGFLNITEFLSFLTEEEFHPQQGYRYLAVQILAYRCEWDKGSRISGGTIRNFAIKRGYCNG